MADSPELKTQKLIKYGNEKFGLNETTLRGILDNATAGSAGPNGEYNIEIVEETDENGKVTQTLNITDWDYVPKPSFDRVFSNNSWTQIAEASEIIKQNNYTSTQVKEIFGWDLQTDTKVDIGKDGISREIQIIGFNHDDLSDGSGKAGMAFQTVHCEPIKYQMGLIDSTKVGYPTTLMRNTTLPTIFSLLSDELQTVIKAVNKKSVSFNADVKEILTTSENIFLLSAIEILNTGDAEGTVYEYWSGKNSTDDKIKKYDKNGDGIPEKNESWWMRSFNGTYFLGFNSFGHAAQSSELATLCISFGFCI